ncbi:phosphoenolpyruvate carboxykinase [Candidatus Micrarchaeota archaeon]|nr:phosphoenolpyruvate carboxykinase [Candidatus Micrarchaeota archaeon]
MHGLFEELHKLAQATPEISVSQALENPRLTKTATGSLSIQSSVTHRLASQTHVVLDETEPFAPWIRKAVDAAKTEDLVAVRRSIGKNAFESCLVLPRKHSCIAGYWASTQFASQQKNPDFITLCLPDYPEQKILVFADAGVTLILGSDYLGESKMSFLRLAMYHAKKQGALGLHAGSKHVVLKEGRKGVLFFGLSGTGKTTLSTHSLFLEKPEYSVVRQDDIVILQKDGRAIGTEENFYVKTEGLKNDRQPGLYAACMNGHALLENVAVRNGQPNFLDSSRTTNARAIVRRRDLPDTDDDVDLPKVTHAFFITRRRDVVPVAAKLSAAQATAFFMLGESVETSASDPQQAGKTRRVVGFNPFIVGDPAVEGNRFLELVTGGQTECFLLNTGRIAEKQNITADVSARLVEQILRDNVVWQADPAWGYQTPKTVPHMDMSLFDPKKYYDADAYQAKVDALKAERRAWLEKFPGLKPEIKDALNLNQLKALE